MFTTKNQSRPIASTLLAFAVTMLTMAPACIVAAPVEIAVDQAALAAKFDRLEALALRIAELAEKESPDRAEQLRAAIAKSRELGLQDRFAAIVGLLEEEQLAAASNNQTALATQLDLLLKQLLADPAEARAEAEHKKLKALLKEIQRLVQIQRGLRAALLDQAENETGEANDPNTNSAEEPTKGDQAKQAIADRQAKLAEAAEQARQKAAEGQPPSQGNPQNGKPSEGQPKEGQPGQSTPGGQQSPDDHQPEPEPEPSNRSRAAKRLDQARQAMEEALEELKKQQDQPAVEKQTEAQRRLEQAREEIAKALEQLREEEQQRMLARLATRFRRMLAEQTDVYEQTIETNDASAKRGKRATRIAAQGLANREAGIVEVASAALRVLEADGKSVAFPHLVEGLRDDMQVVVGRFENAQVAKLTQQLEEDIIEQLQETIAALDRARAELEKKKQQSSQQQQQSGEQGDPDLVDQLAELRMIRSLQARVLRRTAFWQALAEEAPEAQQTTPEERRTALDKLARRQTQLMTAAAQLHKSQEK